MTKMSDVFVLPLDPRFKADAQGIGKDAVTDAAINHAVNCHDRLVEALEFYASEFKPQPSRFVGLEWKPTERLLDDCGNRAVAALAKARGEEV